MKCYVNGLCSRMTFCFILPALFNTIYNSLFQDKPIRARIKTKPMSRLGCLSVLPSYGNKGGGEGKEGSGPPSTPGPTGIAGAGPGTPAPNTNFNNPGGQRFMYSSTPSTVTANSYTYSYTTPTTPMPAAFVSII